MLEFAKQHTDKDFHNEGFVKASTKIFEAEQWNA